MTKDERKSRTVTLNRGVSQPSLALAMQRVNRHSALSVVAGEDDRRAAVAVVLRQGESGTGGLEILYIHRVENPNDPWSGHMAFPGGHMDQGDGSLVETAIREAREELGLDLSEGAKLLGPLDDLRASAGGRFLPLIITPVVFSVGHRLPPLVLRPDEVAGAIWVPVKHLLDPGNGDQVRYPHPDGAGLRVLPCWRVEGRCIWGLTYFMTCNLLSLLGIGRAFSVDELRRMAEEHHPLPDGPASRSD